MFWWSRSCLFPFPSLLFQVKHIMKLSGHSSIKNVLCNAHQWKRIRTHWNQSIISKCKLLWVFFSQNNIIFKTKCELFLKDLTSCLKNVVFYWKHPHAHSNSRLDFENLMSNFIFLCFAHIQDMWFAVCCMSQRKDDDAYKWDDS